MNIIKSLYDKRMFIAGRAMLAPTLYIIKQNDVIIYEPKWIKVHIIYIQRRKSYELCNKCYCLDIGFLWII